MHVFVKFGRKGRNKNELVFNTGKRPDPDQGKRRDAGKCRGTRGQGGGDTQG